jgi:hypothetical protein
MNTLFCRPDCPLALVGVVVFFLHISNFAAVFLSSTFPPTAIGALTKLLVFISVSLLICLVISVIVAPNFAFVAAAILHSSFARHYVTTFHRFKYHVYLFRLLVHILFLFFLTSAALW